MPAIPAIIGVVGAVGAAKVAGDAQKKAAQVAANGSGSSTAGTVNIANLQTQAQDVARQNAANSAALEAQYNPGAQQLRSGSLQSLISALQPRGQIDDLSVQITEQAGMPLSRINAPGAEQYDSALTRAAVEQAAVDLALGGELPQDVRNLISRQAFARSGAVTGGLGLGRDLQARDLGLTSLDLRNRRLQNAAAIAQQEAALNQSNAALRQQANQLGVSVAGLNMQGEQFGRQNLFDSAGFLQNMQSGDFARALAAAQLGQNIAAPQSGLDPGSIVNLAVGNSNLSANAAQNAAAIAAASGNQKAALIGQLGGIAANAYGTYQANKQPVYTLPATTVGAGYGSNIPSIPGYSPSK